MYIYVKFESGVTLRLFCAPYFVNTNKNKLHSFQFEIMPL